MATVDWTNLFGSTPVFKDPEDKNSYQQTPEGEIKGYRSAISDLRFLLTRGNFNNQAMRLKNKLDNVGMMNDEDSGKPVWKKDGYSTALIPTTSGPVLFVQDLTIPTEDNPPICMMQFDNNDFDIDLKLGKRGLLKKIGEQKRREIKPMTARQKYKGAVFCEDILRRNIPKFNEWTECKVKAADTSKDGQGMVNYASYIRKLSSCNKFFKVV